MLCGKASKPGSHPLHGQLSRDYLSHGRAEVKGAEGAMASYLTDFIDRKSSCCDQVARHGLFDPIGLVLTIQSKYGSVVVHIASTSGRGVPAVHVQEHAARLLLHQVLLQAVIENGQGCRIVHLIANRQKFTRLLPLSCCLLLVRTLIQRVELDELMIIAAEIFRCRNVQFVLEELRITHFRR